MGPLVDVNVPQVMSVGATHSPSAANSTYFGSPYVSSNTQLPGTIHFAQGDQFSTLDQHSTQQSTPMVPCNYFFFFHYLVS